MANDEAELSKASAEPGVPPDPPRQTSPDGDENQLYGVPEAAEAKSSPEFEPIGAQPAEAEPLAGDSPRHEAGSEGRIPADAQDSDGRDSDAQNSLETRGGLEPRQLEAAAELTGSPNAALADAPGPVLEQVKLRSRFPALAATALAGGILGFGGTFALRHFEAPPVQAVTSDDRLGALSARVDAIEGKAEASPADIRTALAALETRVAAAESAANKAADLANSAQADLQKEIAARPTVQEQTAAASAPAETPDLEPLNARIGTIEQKVTSLEATLAAPKAELRARQQERETPTAKQGSNAQTVAIVAQSLLHKLEGGGPFSEDLAALENLGVSAESLAPLHASAISSERQLTTQFAALAPAIIEAGAASQASADEGFLDRMTRHAKGLVHIRRVGEPEGTDTEGLVTRIENALADHDLEAAYTAWNQLPSAATAKSESWGEAVKTRLDAINAARSIEADAVAVLGKPKS